MGRTAASLVRDQRAVLTFRGVAEAGEDVFAGEVGEVGEDLLFGHAGREIGQDVVYGDAHAANARLAAAFAGLDGDDVVIAHGVQPGGGGDGRSHSSRARCRRGTQAYQFAGTAAVQALRASLWSDRLRGRDFLRPRNPRAGMPGATFGLRAFARRRCGRRGPLLHQLRVRAKRVEESGEFSPESEIVL